MKISKETLSLLENYSKINQNLKLNEGNMLKTVNAERTVYSVAHIDENFEQPFAIYDLSEFLNTIGMFNDPELMFSGDVLTISDGTDKSMKTRYYSANPAILTEVSDMKNIPEADGVFLLSSKNFKRLEKGGNTLKLKDLRFKAEGGKIVVTAYDASDAIKNTVAVDITDNYTGEDFDVHVRLSKMIILDGEYECSILAGRMLKLKNTARDLIYMVALDVDE